RHTRFSRDWSSDVCSSDLAVYIRDYNPAATLLKSEKADTWTVGAVIRSPFNSGPFSRLNLTVDYFNITINDPISVIGAGAQLLRSEERRVGKECGALRLPS